MSDEQTIYISPDDDLTTVRERLEQIPSRKITLVIPSQTQLRSHVAWKLLSARARELGKEVLIVSSDPQVRSVAHSVKFKVAHPLESVSTPGRSKSGSRTGTGRSNLGSTRSRLAVPPTTTTEKEPTSRQGAPRSPRSTRPPLSGQPSTRSEPGSFTLPKRPDSPQSQFDEPRTGKPHEARPQRPKQSGSSRYNQPYNFRPEAPPAIHPLPINQIEEPDLLIEDYNQARDIRQAATESHTPIQKQDNTEPAITSSDEANTPTPEARANPIPTNQAHQPPSQIYGEDDPFIYMQDDALPPSSSEQKGEAILPDDELSQDYPSLQKSAISDLPTSVTEKRIEHGNDEDEMIPPITQAKPRDRRFDGGDEKAQEGPSRLPTRPYGTPPRDNPYGTPPPSRQTFNEDEEQLPAFPERPAPVQVPQAIPLPMPRAQSKPVASTSKPLAPRTSGQIAPKAPTQKPTNDPVTRGGSRTSRPMGSRPAPPRPIQQRESPTRPRSAIDPIARRPERRNRSLRTRRLLLLLASVVVIFVILFGVLYLNTTSTVKLTVATQDYPHSVTLTLSDKNQPGTVPAKAMTQSFTKTGQGSATGTTLQVTKQASGNVYFTNASTADVVIPSQTVVATTNNVSFVTTANAKILAQGANTVPVPIQLANNQTASGNVPAGSITVIPPDSLASIAQAQSPPVTPDSLKGKLTVNNPQPTTGGEAHQVPAVAQQDLDNAKTDLDKQLQPDIDAWGQQQHTKNVLVGKPIRTDTLTPAVDTPEPDKTFSVSINATVTILVAQLDDVQRVAASQLNNTVHTDPQFGPNFTLIGPIKIDPTTQQNGDDGHTVTVNATGQVGPNLNITDLKNSIKSKPLNEAEDILHQKNQGIKTAKIQTQPDIFNWVSPWVDHITVTVQPASTAR